MKKKVFEAIEGGGGKGGGGRGREGRGREGRGREGRGELLGTMAFESSSLTQ